MATYLNPNISKDGILAIGDNVIYTCPYNYFADMGSFRFTNTAAYDISLRIERADPVSVVTYYSFTLDAGDFLQDAGIYQLKYGDRLIVNVNVANTSYSFVGQVLPINPPD
jgi:hypothetical protein